MELWMKLMLLAGMMAMVFTATAIPASATGENWWNASYDRRHLIPVINTGNFISQLIINSTNINVSEMQDNGADVAIVSYNNATVMKFWIEDDYINKAGNTIIDVLANSNASVWVYWKNNTAVAGYSSFFNIDYYGVNDNYDDNSLNASRFKVLWGAFEEKQGQLWSEGLNANGIRTLATISDSNITCKVRWNATIGTTQAFETVNIRINGDTWCPTYSIKSNSANSQELMYCNAGWFNVAWLNTSTIITSNGTTQIWQTNTQIRGQWNTTQTQADTGWVAENRVTTNGNIAMYKHGDTANTTMSLWDWLICEPHSKLLTYSFTTTEIRPGSEVTNITLTLGVIPTTLYTNTGANLSVLYNESSGLPANLTLNVTVNGLNITNESSSMNYTSVAAGTTIYFYVESGNYSKHDNLSIAVTATTTTETGNATLTKEIQNSLPSAPVITFSPNSVIIGDVLITNSTSTDADLDTLAYWFKFGYTNGTNITAWQTLENFTVNASYENDTIKVYSYSNDGEANSSFNSSTMIVTHMNIVAPTNNQEVIGDTPAFTLNITNQVSQNCTETIVNQTVYYLGLIATSLQNHSRYVWYGNNTYNATCYSKQDPTRVYYKLVNFTNIFANWSVSIYTENDWDVPLAIPGANLSIFIMCQGGSEYVYNFTGATITGVKPLCDVQSITAKVDYPSDSYTRERSVPSCTTCDIRMYMVDALIYTVLQIPIYMSDYNYFDSKVELYKLSGNNHYTIAEGYFDVEHKYVTYLTKDNTYYIRITKGSEVRDIGFLYAASATAQYLSLSSIRLVPSITLISDNLLMSAAFDNASAPLSVLRIQYEDLLNMTQDVRVQIFNDTSNTAWYDNTFTGISNLSIALNGINTSVRYSVHWTVHHTVLGNSPIDFTAGVGAFGRAVDLGLPASLTWIYSVVAFVIMLFTMFIIVPEIRLVGYLLLLVELGIFTYFTWFQFPLATVTLFITFLAAGILYEIKYKGTT